MKYAYISKSLQIDNNYYLEAKKFLLDNNISVDTYTNSNNYYSGKDAIKVENATIFVVLIQNSSGIIGKGVYSEMQRADDLGVPMVILYKRSCDNSFQLYKTKLPTGFLQDKKDWNKYTVVDFVSNITEDVLVNDKYNLQLKSNAMDYKPFAELCKKQTLLSKKQLNKKLLLCLKI